MIEKFAAWKILPSPLLLEGEDRLSYLKKLSHRALCETLCGTCKTCKMLAKGFHPDLIWLGEESKMEDIREALTKLRQRPFEATHRVLVIENLHDANAAMQNALLKTLEEPLPHWKILLGINSRFAALPTLRSRCLYVKLPPPEKADELTESEQSIFEKIRDRKDLELSVAIETPLKDRAKAKSCFIRLLSAASQKSYPGHWLYVAEPMEQSLAALDRNLNSKIVWDRLWAKSIYSAEV